MRTLYRRPFPGAGDRPLHKVRRHVSGLRGVLVVAWACLSPGAQCAAQAADAVSAASRATAPQPNSNVEITLVDGREATFRLRYLPGRNGFFSEAILARRYRVHVDAGEDLQGAIVDRLIDVIAVYTPEAFWWDSRRLQRDVLLSALPADRAATRHFLYRELFAPK